MISLYALHKQHYRSLTSQETFKDRENEFNKLISEYELNPKDIAKYLLLVREDKKSRKELIHKLITNYEYANAIAVITELL